MKSRGSLQSAQYVSWSRNIESTHPWMDCERSRSEFKFWLCAKSDNLTTFTIQLSGNRYHIEVIQNIINSSAVIQYQSTIHVFLSFKLIWFWLSREFGSGSEIRKLDLKRYPHGGFILLRPPHVAKSISVSDLKPEHKSWVMRWDCR